MYACISFAICRHNIVWTLNFTVETVEFNPRFCFHFKIAAVLSNQIQGRAVILPGDHLNLQLTVVGDSLKSLMLKEFDTTLVLIFLQGVLPVVVFRVQFLAHKDSVPWIFSIPHCKLHLL